jgi:hypothetical protein
LACADGDRIVTDLQRSARFAGLALSALGRTVFALGAGYIAAASGWVLYFVICTAAAIPSFVLLFVLISRGHFAELGGDQAAKLRPAS